MLKTTLALTFLFAAMNASAQNVDRTKPPETGPLPPFKLPPVHETRLANGLRVVLVEDRRFPLVTVRLGFRAGSKFDPKDLPGLSEAAGALLTEGTKTRSSREIAEELAGIGGALSAASSPDALILHGNSLAENTDRLLDLVADVAIYANFPEEEVALQKKKRLQELLAERSQASYWADEKIESLVFGDHPYSRTNPTPESIQRLDRAAVAGFRDQMLTPNNAVLILLGALPAREKTLELLKGKFGAWQGRELTAAPAAKFPEPARSIVLVDRPGSVQADIRVGRIAVNRNHPDYFPLLVTNTILGGGASSRMFMNIREKQGFAYDAHSSMQPRKDAGMFVAVTQVRNEVIEAALQAVEGELKNMGAAPVAADELTDVKNYLSGIFVMGLETQSGLANQLVNLRLMEVPNDYLEKYTTRVRSVEPPQIQAVAKKYMAPDHAGIVVVGDASVIRKPVEKFGKVVVEKAE